MDKIVVHLYGGKNLFSKKETPLRAEEVYCDKYEKCSIYKNGCCLNITTSFGCRCKFGTVKKIQGYTSRAQKYGQFKGKYKGDEVYGKLNYPSNCKIAVIDDYVYLNVTYASVTYENDRYCVKRTGFCSTGGCWIELSKFDCELLNEICSCRPQAMMGGEITDYQESYIPDMLQQFKKVLPELYSEFIKKYPKFDIEPNYVGKYAYVKTLVKGSIITDSHGNDFKFDGEYLTCPEGSLTFAPFDAKTVEMKIKVTDKMKYEIDDNSQVDENTIFVQ